MKKIEILDCTLRDGSYVIDFQFTAEDTAVIAAGLEDAGVKLIEIGHGLGLNASNCGEGVAAATDEEYLEAAAMTLKKSKFGMFFIPGIGRKKDLKMASRYGMDFVRIGTNATEVHLAKKYIKYAKTLGMLVFSNLMKSYALKPKALARQAKLAESWGADVVTIVDSAGGMLPQEVEEYVKTVKNALKIDVGFHGHDNLSMVHANCLAAINAGATIIDCSMQGMGRSGGNARTETLLTILKKLGYEIDIDIHKIMDLSERLIKPIIYKRGKTDIDIVLGYAKFHSKFLDIIYRAAEKYEVDPRELVVRVAEREKVRVPEELVEKIAQELSSEKKRLRTLTIPEKERRIYFKPEDFSHKSIRKSAKKIANELLSLSKKTGKESIFTISLSSRPRKSVVFPFIRESYNNVIGNAEVFNEKQAIEIAKVVDGIVDYIFVDAERKSELDLLTLLREAVKKSKVLPYKDSDAWIRAVANFLSVYQNVGGKNIVICGCNHLSYKLALDLAERGAKVTLFDNDVEKIKRASNLDILKSPIANQITCSTSPSVANGADIVVGFTIDKPIITKELIEKMRPGVLILDAGIGSIEREAIEYAQNNGAVVCRLDMRAGLSGEIVTVLETDYLIKNIFGKTLIAGIPVVAGGYIGARGDIVVDSISNPTRVIGVADGRGGLLKKIGKKEIEKIKKVKFEILKKKIES